MRDQSEKSRVGSARSLAGKLLVHDRGLEIFAALTRLSYTNPDTPAHEARVCERKCLLQSIQRSELDVAETLGLAIQLVLDDPDRGDLAVR